jgi:hypothetical protein
MYRPEMFIQATVVSDTISHPHSQQEPICAEEFFSPYKMHSLWVVKVYHSNTEHMQSPTARLQAFPSMLYYTQGNGALLTRLTDILLYAALIGRYTSQIKAKTNTDFAPQPFCCLD